MAGFAAFLAVYLLGGLTFLPLVIALAIYLTTRPVLPDPSPAPPPLAPTAPERKRSLPKDDYNYDGLVLPGDDVKTLESVRREHAQEKASKGGGGARKHRSDRTDDFATAGYFAVHRKYVAMGVNSKPIEPGSVGPTPVAPPSPSVYQTFFRNMLNKKSGSDTVEVSNAASPRPKNARNMYYVVLRHGHLILFDDDQQVDVRHVIKLADHDVQISSGGSPTPEGELFIKRNAIHLAPKNLQRAKAHNAPTPQPWFFYCENCSEKEDFYFSLLRSQENAPQPHEIDVRHLTALMERLHASEEAAEMRWLNALIGRLFLGVYKTTDVLHFVQSKIVTKLSRTPRPSFIASLIVQRVDIGETTPQITSPRLKSLTAEGECIVEADIRYTGRFEIDIAAILRVSTPIGQQEVKTSVAVVLTHLEGHILLKIKAPPSNRVWFSFRHMPKIEMEVRPIIMARQLTWPVFIQMIEGKIKEAIAESVVLPYWDDTPFFSTEKKPWRGGLWEDASDKAHDGTAMRTDDATQSNGADAKAQAASSTGVASETPGGEENVSPAVLRLRRLSKVATSPAAPTLSSTSVNSLGSNPSDKAHSPSHKKKSKKNQLASDINDPIGGSPSPKLPSRASTLSVASDPTVGTDRAHAEAAIQPPSPLKNGQGSSSAMSWLSSGTLRRKASNISMSAAETTDGHDADATPRQNGRRPSSKQDDDKTNPYLPDDASETQEAPSAINGGEADRAPLSPASQAARAATFASQSSTPSLSKKKSFERATTIATTPDGDNNAKTSAVLAAAMTGAAQSAKRWGINALQRRATAAAERKARAELEHRKGSAELDLTKPMGGGLPLPPLGEPLPLPSELVQKTDAPTGSGSPAPERKIKRKQVQSHAQPAAARRPSSAGDANSFEPPQEFLVVAAPIDSEPEEEEDDRAAHPDASSLSIPAAEDHEDGEDGDDAQWGELAESVISAFLQEDNEQTKGRGEAGTAHQPSQEESLISFEDTADAASHEESQKH